jgi:hypothetical protein
MGGFYNEETNLGNCIVVVVNRGVDTHACDGNGGDTTVPLPVYNE